MYVKEFLVSVEQVARDFVINMLLDPDKAKGQVTSDAMASGGALPATMPLTQALPVAQGLKAAIPDLKIDVQNVAVNGNQATVDVMWGGTQSGSLNLPVPGMPAVPPTGKKIWVKDAYTVTVQGDKVSNFHVESPADGGIPAMLSQLGIHMPRI